MYNLPKNEHWSLVIQNGARVIPDYQLRLTIQRLGLGNKNICNLLQCFAIKYRALYSGFQTEAGTLRRL